MKIKVNREQGAQLNGVKREAVERRPSKQGEGKAN